jgi:amino acid adenylation domain-containing protein
METPVTAGFWLSPQQKQVWTLQQDGKALRAAALLTVESDISAATAAAALKSVADRHEILRTVYVRQTGMRFPFQAVLDTAEPEVHVQDLSTLSPSDQTAKLNEIFAAAQSPSTGPERAPIVSLTLSKLASGRTAVLLSVPAMAADAASLDILGRDFVHALTGTLPGSSEEPLRYAQFAQWQNDLVDGNDENAPKAMEFWSALDQEPPALNLPHEAKPAANFLPQVVTGTLDATDAQGLDTLAVRLDATPAEVFLGAWQCLLWRLTGLPIFRVGVLFDFREYDELRNAVGLIAKNIPIEARFDGDFSFRDVVEHVHASVAKAAEWQEYFVPGKGSGSDAPIAFECRAATGLQRVAVNNDFCKLKLCVTRGESGAALEFFYDSSRLPRQTVERIAGYYANLVKAGVSDAETSAAKLPLLDSAERNRMVVEWNRTESAYVRDKSYHQLFEAQAVATPDRLAVRCNEESFTYRELNEKANQLAHYLRSLGVGAVSLVGLSVDRSAEMMVAVLGILKAGGAYVPLNPDNPKPRTLQQLTGAKVLVTEAALLPNMPDFGGTTLCLDRDAGQWAQQPRDNLPNQTSPDDLVYVIYTSGSTGTPKGVAVRHRNLVNYSSFIARRLRLDEHPEGLQFATVSTIGADLGNTCIYPALISGGCLHVIGYNVSTDAQSMADYTSRYPVDVLKIVPSHLQALLDSSYAAKVLPRKFLVLGGETFTPNLAEKIYSLGPTCEVFNHYGPTETTIGSLTLRLADYDWRNSSAASIPIGRPIANTQIYILDSQLQLVPTGVTGELYIAGDGVTAGYLNQPERTEERFVKNPFSSDSSSRMYRTGDLARYQADGNVEFLGRGDDQVKIRGFRIELGEIEAVLTSRAGVKQAFVLAKEDSRGGKRLVAYVVGDQSAATSPDDLKSYLKSQLPEFMVPSAIVPMAKIPLTPNGKVDRQALPEPESVQQKEYVAPKTPTEEGVAKIWQQVLRREPIGTDENFFELGGHSLLATQVISRIREQFRIELPIRAIFDHPTIVSLAKAISSTDNGAAKSAEPAITRVSREAYRAGKH